MGAWNGKPCKICMIQLLQIRLKILLTLLKSRRVQNLVSVTLARQRIAERMVILSIVRISRLRLIGFVILVIRLSLSAMKSLSKRQMLRATSIVICSLRAVRISRVQLDLSATFATSVLRLFQMVQTRTAILSHHPLIARKLRPSLHGVDMP